MGYGKKEELNKIGVALLAFDKISKRLKYFKLLYSKKL